jgi:hypothetical protein
MPCALTQSIMQQDNGDWQWALAYSDGGHIVPSRNRLSQEAIDLKTDYLLFVDNDQILELDTVNKLLSLNKDVVVSVIPDRNGEEYLCMREEDGTPIKKVTEDRKIGRGGCGTTLIKTKVLKDIFDSDKMGDPFDNLQIDEGGHIVFLGEDESFCERAKCLGYEIWCKHNSNPQHIGRPKRYKYDSNTNKIYEL